MTTRDKARISEVGQDRRCNNNSPIISKEEGGCLPCGRCSSSPCLCETCRGGCKGESYFGEGAASFTERGDEITPCIK